LEMGLLDQVCHSQLHTFLEIQTNQPRSVAPSVVSPSSSLSSPGPPRSTCPPWSDAPGKKSTLSVPFCCTHPPSPLTHSRPTPKQKNP
jgi:hypothetical protein